MTNTNGPPIRIKRLSHMRYQHVDMTKTRQFLEDFGMHVVHSENDGQTLYLAGDGSDAFVYVATSVSTAWRIQLTPGRNQFVPWRHLPGGDKTGP